MEQDKRWDQHWREIVTFVQERRRMPSRHNVEDHLMLNWIKYNRRQLKAGKMSADRQERFLQLLALGDSFRKVNQYAYRRPPQGLLPFDDSEAGTQAGFVAESSAP